MAKRLQSRLKANHINMAWLINQKAKGVSTIGGTSIDDKIESVAGKLAQLTAKMSGYVEPEDPEEPWQPNFPDRKEVLAMPVFDELRIHYMCLPGWAYRNIDENPNMVYQQIYEVARRTRIAGAKYLRTFLINGSKKASERYICDALPWEMVKVDNRKLIDFDTSNKKYWRVLKIIEEACLYWHLHHMPTFWMDRYNNDIFNRVTNVQGIHGFWEFITAPVKVAFMEDFLLMQKDVRQKPDYQGYFEFINEPMHNEDHALGGVIADHHLLLWRGIEHLTIIGRATTCSGGSEYSHANFVEKHEFDNRTFGSAEFKDREITPEYHSVSTLQGLLHDFDVGLGSGWKRLAYNEDGADDGSYNPIPWTEFRLANSQELKDTMEYGHRECKRKGKRFIMTVFMMDCLRQDKQDNMIAKEEFDPQQIEHMCWDRPNQYRKMRKEESS